VELNPGVARSGRNLHFCLNTPTIAAYPCISSLRAPLEGERKPNSHAGCERGNDAAGLNRTQEVGGSNPPSSIQQNPCMSQYGFRQPIEPRPKCRSPSDQLSALAVQFTAATYPSRNAEHMSANSHGKKMAACRGDETDRPPGAQIASR